MKRLDIIMPQEYLPEVNELLHRHKVGGMSFYDVKGRGRAKQRPVKVGRGVMTYVPEFGFRTKVEVLVQDSKVKEIIDDVLATLGAGKATAAIGKIFVYDVEDAYDIGSAERGDVAL
ncbi:P-II family nitrogen regulator [Nitrososphaera sp.]|uniref:P-II family nitrogen regulator n=1 Tax=Nitrososphaera sp. TaxID=1971748 RepID=UPI00307D2E25